MAFDPTGIRTPVKTQIPIMPQRTSAATPRGGSAPLSREGSTSTLTVDGRPVLSEALRQYRAERRRERVLTWLTFFGAVSIFVLMAYAMYGLSSPYASTGEWVR